MTKWRKIVEVAVITGIAGGAFVLGRCSIGGESFARQSEPRTEQRGPRAETARASLSDVENLLVERRGGEERGRSAPDQVTAPGVESPAVESSEPRSYLRVARGEHGEPVALQSAIVRFQPRQGSRGAELFGENASISLIGAVHIGEEKYYQRLNQEFGTYDKVLYEMVGPRGVRPTAKRDAAQMDLFSGFQYLLTDYFGMVHQVDRVDYSPAHFVHADLSMQDLVSEGERRGESMLTIGVGVLTDMMKSYNKLSRDGAAASGAGKALAGGDSSPPGLLRQFAEVMASTGGEGIGGTLGPYLIDMRNQEALRVMEDELGSGAHHVAIFYGAAHLPKMERSLVRDYGMKPVSERWISAWDLRARDGQKTGEGFARAMPRLKMLFSSFAGGFLW